MEVQPESFGSMSLPFVEALYADYLRDPETVDPQWRRYFEGLDAGAITDRPALGPSFRPRSIFHPPPDGNGSAANGSEANSKAALARAARDQFHDTELWQ